MEVWCRGGVLRSITKFLLLSEYEVLRNVNHKLRQHLPDTLQIPVRVLAFGDYNGTCAFCSYRRYACSYHRMFLCVGWFPEPIPLIRQLFTARSIPCSDDDFWAQDPQLRHTPCEPGDTKHISLVQRDHIIPCLRGDVKLARQDCADADKMYKAYSIDRVAPSYIHELSVRPQEGSTPCLHALADSDYGGFDFSSFKPLESGKRYLVNTCEYVQGELLKTSDNLALQQRTFERGEVCAVCHEITTLPHTWKFAN